MSKLFLSLLFLAALVVSASAQSYNSSIVYQPITLATNTGAAVVIGTVSAILCFVAVRMKNKLRWDDALDVWGVHGVGGIIGTILCGVFAVKSINGVSGLIEGDVDQFLTQVVAVVITTVYSFGVTYGILKIINVFEPVRVPDDVQVKGLDIAIHGETAYDL